MDLSKAKDEDMVNELKKRYAMFFFVACKTHTLQNEDAVMCAAKSKDLPQLGRLIQYAADNVASRAQAQNPIIMPPRLIN